MSWRFRKSFSVIPGVRLNVTRRGFSATIGVAPVSVNVGRRGAHVHLSIPGTGLSNRIPLDSQDATVDPGGSQGGGTPPKLVPEYAVPAGEEIRSASTELMNSPAMDGLPDVLRETQTERTATDTEVRSAESEFNVAARRFHAWDKGFLFKKLFKSGFDFRKSEFELSSAKLEELREQLKLTVVSTEINIEGPVAEAYFKMRDAFSALSECQSTWDKLSRAAINRAVTRSAASEGVTRALVKFSLRSSDLITWDQRVPFLPNTNGGDMYIYPGFVLYRASHDAFALIDFVEIGLDLKLVKFIEQGGAYPSDSQISEYVWEKSNKDGSQDRRFAGNRQFPALLYADLKLTSPEGLHEEFQFSNISLAEKFCRSWAALQALLAERDDIPSDGHV